VAPLALLRFAHRPTVPLLAGALGGLLHGRVEPPREPLVEHQCLDRVPGHIRASDRAHDPRPAVLAPAAQPHEHQLARAHRPTLRAIHAVGGKHDATSTAGPPPVLAGAERWEVRLRRPKPSPLLYYRDDNG